MNIIHSLLVHGHEVLFVEEEDGCIDLRIKDEDDLLEEEINCIVSYLQDEGILQEIGGQEAIDEIEAEVRAEMEEEED